VNPETSAVDGTVLCKALGSIARGEEKPDSDIDLCIVAKDGADKDVVRGKLWN